MPDFNTHKPQDPNEANKVRVGLMATKLKSSMMADKLLSLLIVVAVVAFLLFMWKAVPMAQRLYASSWLGPETIGEATEVAATVTCDTLMLDKTGECASPDSAPYYVCESASRGAVNDHFLCEESSLPLASRSSSGS